MKSQKKRHSLFANMGRLLYEAFSFYASTDSKVAVLYHGMGVELLFEELYCSFNAPTSTTTEESVACSFASGGVVMKLENADSNPFIKTLDMALFTCYDNEAEQLIFKTRLHIKDIYLPRIGYWIGNGIMNRMSFYDL